MATRNLGPLASASMKLDETDADGKPVYAFVARGQALPDNIAKGEENRLEAAGAFLAPTRPMTVQVARDVAREVLPPSVTLSANPELDGDAFVGPPPQASNAPTPPAEIAVDLADGAKARRPAK